MKGLGFRISVCALATAMSLAAPVSAQCPRYLYWGKTPTFADNVPTCFSRARAGAGAAGLTGIRQNNMEVAGSKGNTYVSITCVGTTPRATAIIMAVGNNDGETRGVRDDVQNKVAHTQGL